MTHCDQSIKPTHAAGVGTVGGIDIGSDSDDDFFGDAEAETVLDADGPDAAEGAFDDDAAEDEPVEEAPMKLPKNPSDPSPEEREKHNKVHVPRRSLCSICMSAR